MKPKIWLRVIGRRFACSISPVVAATLVLGLVSASSAGAAGDELGRDVYVKYCASCHGWTGKGEGPVAEHLSAKPADLTRLATTWEEGFSYMRVKESIDGTRTIRAHGTSDMPVWGERFRDEPSFPLGARAETQGKLMLITEYVKSIQKK